jgi:LysM repeat protein
MVLRQPGEAGDPPPPATYTVVSGDTLSGIAVKTGKSVADLSAWNGISDPNSINIGQVLKLGPQ